MAEICTKCFRPKHAVSQVGGETFVSCVEMPKDVIIFVENYRCGCCKCPTTLKDIDEIAFRTPKTVSEQMDDKVKEFLAKDNVFIYDEDDVVPGSLANVTAIR